MPDQDDATQPATRADLQALRADLQTDIQAAVGASEQRNQEFARRLQTELLTAFHEYARGQFAAVHRIQVSDADLAERLSALESRVLSLEARHPPQ